MKTANPRETLKFWIKYIFPFICLMSRGLIMFLSYHFPDSNIPSLNYIFSLINGIRFDIATLAYFLLPIWFLHLLLSIPNNFNGGNKLFAINYNSGVINLIQTYKKENVQSKLKNTMIGYILSAHYSLNTYKCGLNISL